MLQNPHWTFLLIKKVWNTVSCTNRHHIAQFLTQLILPSPSWESFRCYSLDYHQIHIECAKQYASSDFRLVPKSFWELVLCRGFFHLGIVMNKSWNLKYHRLCKVIIKHIEPIRNYIIWSETSNYLK